MSNHKKLILSVDDEFIITESLRIQLERNFGDTYILEFADSAETGLEILQDVLHSDISQSLVITDWMMPGIKGDEFAKTIRSTYPQTKIIMLTGQVDHTVLNVIIENNFVDKVIAKPWLEYQIIEAINELIESK